jgi:hypothetical protein
MNTPDLRSALKPVITAFQSLGVRYRIGGSLASTVFGLARATLDADLVAAIEPENTRALVELLQPEYYMDARAVEQAVRERASFNLIHLATMLKIDVFALSARPYDRQAFTRVVESPLDADDEDLKAVCFVSPEDIVLKKLEWYRLGNEVSERQWGDVLGVMKVQAGELDLAYLDPWARELGLSDLLEKALRESGLRPSR